MTAASTPATTRLRLYLAGESPNSLAALRNLRAALEPFAHLPVQLDVFDVVADPDQAVRDGVFVTPMLIKVEPLPERRVLGRLHDRALLLGVLDLIEATRE